MGALVMAALLTAPPAKAALYASLDRYSIAMGDTVRLTLRSDGDSDPADADLSGLSEDFEILQRSSSVSTRIVNGERSQNRELLLEITPLREGDIVIPPFEVDGQRSEALAVTVGPPPEAGAADEVVLFDAEVDRSEVYVQGQLLLTLRIQQAVNLESRSITELEIADAYVETLGQNSFQRMIDGRPWLVHEIRYAIFPEASGELRIPAQTFSGRLGSGRRTLFDTRPAGRLIRRRTEEIVVPVQPRPAAFPDATWLPAANVTIEEQWSGSLDQLKIGDSVTRTITVTGDGLQGAQLPPMQGATIDGLRAYPDQPTIENVTGDSGVTGVRTDSVALVAVRPGEYELPPVEVPWWDTGSDTLRTARLPARRIRVLPGAAAAQGAAGTDAGVDAAARSADRPATVVETRSGIWPWVAAFCAAGWLVTSLWWWRAGRTRSREGAGAPAPRRSPRALLAACRAGDAATARRELLAWIQAKDAGATLAGWLRKKGDPALQQAVDDLEAALYRDGAGDSESWDGHPLAATIERLEAEQDGGEERDGLPRLYPVTPSS
jgi:hypothetical protein